MFLIPPPPSRRVMEQKSWLNIMQLNLLPTDLHDQFSGRNKRSSHPFLLPLFYSGVLWSSIPQTESGILPNFAINVSKLCCSLFESFTLVRNCRQTSELWTSLQILGTKLCTSELEKFLYAHYLHALWPLHGNDLVALLIFTEILVIWDIAGPFCYCKCCVKAWVHCNQSGSLCQIFDCDMSIVRVNGTYS